MPCDWQTREVTVEQVSAYALALLGLVVLSVGLVTAAGLVGVLLRLGRLDLGERLARRSRRARVRRRCSDCGRGWTAVSGRRTSVLGLRLRRWLRRSGLARRRPLSVWAEPAGWARCPACLSPVVHTTRELAGPLPGRPGRLLPALGWLGVVLGSTALAAAAVGAVRAA